MEIEIGKLIKKAKLIRCGDGEYPVLSMTMHDGLMFQNDRFKKQIASVDQSQYQVVQRHQLVESFPIDEGVLAVQELTDAGIVSPAYKIWDVDMEKVVPKYLEFALRAPKSIEYYKFKLRGTTARRRSIPDAEFCAMRIKCPSLDEQKIIVDTIEKTKRVIDSRNLELDTLDDLIKARFVEMFGNPLDGTAKYPIHQVGEIANSVDPQPSHRTPPIDEDGIPYVSIKDCDYKTGKIDFEGARKVSRKVLEEHLNRYTLHDGDFVIGKIGTIGNPVFVPARDDYTLSANVILVQPNSKLVSPYFLKYSFESDFVERQFAEAKNSTSQAAFGIQKVRTVEVMNPDLSVQMGFEDFVKQVDKSKLLVQKSLDETQVLFNSLMQKYFG